MLVIAGTTAVGKTSLSLELAKRLGGEIISADSVQVHLPPVFVLALISFSFFLLIFLDPPSPPPPPPLLFLNFSSCHLLIFINLTEYCQY